MLLLDRARPFRPTELRFALACLSTLVAALALASSPTRATTTPGATFRVGTDVDCDFATLDEALFAAALNDLVAVSQDTILLASNQAYEGQYSIPNHSVVLEGGYDDCADTTPGKSTVIEATAAERAILISGDDGRDHHVTLRNVRLILPATPSSPVAYAGGLLGVGGPGAHVRIEDSFLGGGYSTLGGQVTVYDDAELELLRSFCGSGKANDGGSFWITGGAQVSILQSYLEGNSAPAGAIAYVNSGSALRIESSILAGNLGDSLIATYDTSTFDGNFLTVGGNTPSSQPTWVLHDDHGVGPHRVANSIVWDTDGRVAPAGSSAATNAWRCLLIDHASKDPGGTYVQAGDPLWLGDFELQPGSPAIDFCDGADAPTVTDYAGGPRGHDHAGTPDLYGPFDLGAFAYHGIFADGFESGALASWSGTG